MTPKQQRAILVVDGRASWHGIICKTCEEMHIGTQESYIVGTNRYAQALYLSVEYGDFRRLAVRCSSSGWARGRMVLWGGSGGEWADIYRIFVKRMLKHLC